MPSDIDTAEAYDNLRLIVADVVNELGGSVRHGLQALESTDIGADPSDEWEQAADVLARALDRLHDAHDLCPKLAGEEPE